MSTLSDLQTQLAVYQSQKADYENKRDTQIRRRTDVYTIKTNLCNINWETYGNVNRCLFEAAGDGNEGIKKNEHVNGIMEQMLTQTEQEIGNDYDLYEADSRLIEELQIIDQRITDYNNQIAATDNNISSTQTAIRNEQIRLAEEAARKAAEEARRKAEEAARKAAEEARRLAEAAKKKVTMTVKKKR